MATLGTANSIKDFLDAVLDRRTEGKIICYRGHADGTFKLAPKIFRETHHKAKLSEEKILSELLTEAPEEFFGDRTTFDQLVRAQHYGLPTRLLDVSMNPLVGLFFSCYGERHADEDGEVVLFNVSEDRVKLFDSDTVSCIANMARLSYDEKNKLFKLYNSMRGKGGSSAIDLDEFKARPEVERLVQFIRVEKPYFLNAIKPIDLARWYFVIPRKTNKRLIAQSGGFVLAGLLRTLGDQTSKAFLVDRVIIPAGSKSKILKDLDQLHVNGRTLFPEIESVTKYIEQRYV